MATDLGISVLPVHDEVIIPVLAKRTMELILASAFQHVLKILVTLGPLGWIGLLKVRRRRLWLWCWRMMIDKSLCTRAYRAGKVTIPPPTYI